MNNSSPRQVIDAGSIEGAKGASERIRLRRFPPIEESTHPAFISAVGLVKSYNKSNVSVPVLRGVDFAAQEGKITAIIGQSGSGKSTLLHLLGTLDQPDEGEVHFMGERIDTLPRSKRDLFRNQKLGMIFQFYHLLPELSMLENVLTPCMIGQSFWSYFTQRKAMRERAEHLLETVGLSHRIHHRPRELSGGEMQRAAIARALISDPQILLADEPTGNLDQETGRGVLEILHQLNRDKGLTIVMVTHDESIAAQADRLVRLVQGKVQVVK